MSFKDFLHYVSMSESEVDVAMRSLLLRRAYSQELEETVSRERSSSFSKPPKSPTEVQSKPETSDPGVLPDSLVRLESIRKVRNMIANQIHF
mmetsp:Transcript_65495/g.96954  ORF Transcript_65495/g.96954 Transcript_65495/m.96954 type:complete len:92 (-) Transcript_65495:252-527(-)